MKEVELSHYDTICAVKEVSAWTGKGEAGQKREDKYLFLHDNIYSR